MKSKTFTSVRAEEAIISEGNGRISREQIVLSAPAARILANTVLGKITATGEYAPFNPAGVDGTETAVAMSLVTEDPTDPVSDIRTGAFVREGELNGNMLVWPEGITDPQKVAAEAQLADQGIIVRY